MIDFTKFQELKLTVDPYTYLALENIAEIKGIPLEDFAAHILVHNSTVYEVAECLFKAWVKFDEELCTKLDV